MTVQPCGFCGEECLGRDRVVIERVVFVLSDEAEFSKPDEEGQEDRPDEVLHFDCVSAWIEGMKISLPLLRG